MIYTVSTIKDRTENIEAFVARNLAAGADHAIVFLEGDDTETQAKTLESPHVTAIPAGLDYWRGQRPALLNARQIANANLANVLLAPFRWAEWLFHIDGDECLDIDRDFVAELPKHVHAVRLHTLEAVSRSRWHGDVTHFKKPLHDHELRLLHRRGMISRPNNRAYFRGHTIGKAGLRPSPFLAPRIHDVKTHNDAKLRLKHHPSLRVLHYESATGEEFIRKWTALVAKGNQARFRPERRVIAEAVETILRSSEDEATKRARLWNVYEQHGQDDLETLDSLGLLVSPNPRHHSYTPRAHTPKQTELLHALLPHLLRADKRYFRPRYRGHHPRDLLRYLAAWFRSDHLELAQRLDFGSRR